VRVPVGRGAAEDHGVVLPSGPWSVRAHFISYAASSYNQQNSGATCDFGGTANLTETDPSAYRIERGSFSFPTRIPDHFTISAGLTGSDFLTMQAPEPANTRQARGSSRPFPPRLK
jgi:hypothetical protein